MTSSIQRPSVPVPSGEKPSWFNRFCVASSVNDVDVMVSLLAAYEPSIDGALNQVDEDGWGALHYAVANDCAGALRLLLSHGFDINAATQSFNVPRSIRSPLHIACTFKCLDCLEVLLKGGADLGFHAVDGKNAMDFLFEVWTTNPIEQVGSIRCLQLLLDAGMTTTPTREDGFGAIHACASRGLALPLSVLLKTQEAQANRDAFNKVKQGPLSVLTPLGFAFRNDRPECVALLLDAGCDPHLANPEGECALDFAMKNSASLSLYRSRLALESAKQALASAMDGAAPQAL